MSKPEAGMPFNPVSHTPDALNVQLAQLPRSVAVIGTVGRCLLMGEARAMHRGDMTAVDIDALPLASDNPWHVVGQPFPIDTKLSNWIHPIDAEEWGLFLPDMTEEPIATIRSEVFEPVEVDLDKEADLKTLVMPANVQLELLSLYGLPYRKHPAHKRNFIKWAEKHAEPFPADAAEAFEAYQERSSQWRKRSLSLSERLYREARSFYIGYMPHGAQRQIDKSAGAFVRKLRGTVA